MHKRSWNPETLQYMHKAYQDNEKLEITNAHQTGHGEVKMLIFIRWTTTPSAKQNKLPEAI